MEPLPRMDIFTPVSSCNRFMEFPRGPSSFPTKLNYDTQDKYKHNDLSVTFQHMYEVGEKGNGWSQCFSLLAEKGIWSFCM